MNSSLKARFERLGPTRVVNQNPSGFAVTLRIDRPESLRGIKTIDAIFALHKRGISMLKAKRSIEDVLESGHTVCNLPFVESTAALQADIIASGLAACRLEPADTAKLRALRTSLGMTREQFSLRYGLSVENIRNWEEGRREIDSTARSYLTAIMNDPQSVPLPYEVAAGT